MLAGSFFSSLKGIVDAPKNVTIALAQSLPAQANYYINYVCLMAFVGNGIEITRIFWLIYITCCLKWYKFIFIIFFRLDTLVCVHRFYAHANRFCVVQENIKPEVLKVQTELARTVH